MSSAGRRVVILGAGISGLTTAWKLAEKGWRVTVLEKEETVGGLARSVRTDGCSFDYGPHQLYTSFDEIVEEWRDLLGEDLLTCTKVARVRFYGKVLHYPLSTGDILHSIPLTLSARCFANFAWTRLKNLLRSTRDDSFEDWVVNRFGRTLYSIHFGPYTEKVWGIPPNRITADAAEKRIAVQSLWQVLLKTLFKTKARYKIRTKIHHSPYQTTFRYPRKGLSQLVDRLLERVEGASGTVLRGAVVEGVDLDASRVLYRDSQGEQSLEFDQLVSTLPIDLFPRLCRPAPPEDVLAMSRALRFRALCMLHLVVKRPQVTPAHWIYFPEPHLNFQRSAEYSNFSRECAPEGRSSFSLEIPCFVGDERWTAPDSELFAEAMKGIEETGILRRDEVESYSIVRTPNAYPLFEIESQRQSEAVLAHFRQQHPRVHFTGRQARFSYINIDHCMRFAGELATRIGAAER
jgi:protoporphyrinogen oxidase